ncbi:hypothetical protein HUT16_01590 [Kitasatospora sp. NA04385]|uniref:hypothetical protein n=1 Tax=Kitasatospora sp. NA04385 TaxID=2742135 RepID=UPI001591C8B1|nr:hypothetical protein [Kitasatospora sp. NA04385]QKW17924.1 hypothetical protein HUT16_01590 [Kitasatospora sp. NA04385]
MRTSTPPASIGPAPAPRPVGRPLTVAEALVVVVIVLTAGALALAGLPNIAITGLIGTVTYAARRAVTGLRAPGTPTADRA